MKKLLFGTMLLALVIVVPIPTMAAVDINVAIPLPPPIASQAPPDVIDNQGWGYYNNVPSFYFDVDPGWRGYYRDHNWNGHRWNYERIPNQRLQQNWKSWHNDRHWEKQGTWGVQGYQPRPQKERQAVRQQRQKQYQQRPEVQQHQPQRQEQRPQAQKPQGQPQRQPQERVQRVQQPQRQEQRPQAQQPQHAQPQGKPEGREGEHQK
ncbi:MAG: hypothetical protein ABSE25_04620 [Syntrophorhabdales bacterium]